MTQTKTFEEAVHRLESWGRGGGMGVVPVDAIHSTNDYFSITINLVISIF